MEKDEKTMNREINWNLNWQLWWKVKKRRETPPPRKKGRTLEKASQPSQRSSWEPIAIYLHLPELFSNKLSRLSLAFTITTCTRFREEGERGRESERKGEGKREGVRTRIKQERKSEGGERDRCGRVEVGEAGGRKRNWRREGGTRIKERRKRGEEEQK